MKSAYAKRLIIAGLVLTIAVIAFGAWKMTELKPETLAPPALTWEQLKTVPDRSRIKARINGQELELEVVNTPQSMTQGLSDRVIVGSDGMLFVFPQLMRPKFWMKDMRINLDMVWLNQNKIQEITPNVLRPPDLAYPYELPTYQPAQPVTGVLEVSAGEAARQGWQPGATIEFVSILE
jgi:uncharacterized membrane protein (UPF0127 family)